MTLVSPTRTPTDPHDVNETDFPNHNINGKVAVNVFEMGKDKLFRESTT
jgi:hypothetical protein